LEKFHQHGFIPANFVVAASGRFLTATSWCRKLEALFADWPFKGESTAAHPDECRLCRHRRLRG